MLPKNIQLKVKQLKIRKGVFYVLDINHSQKRRKGEFLIALAVALDGDGIKLGLGDDGDLGVEVDAERKRLKAAWQI